MILNRPRRLPIKDAFRRTPLAVNREAVQPTIQIKPSQAKPSPKVLSESEYVPFLTRQSNGDSAHDLSHVRRVVANAKKFAIIENADVEIVVPAAWLHDCVSSPKDSVAAKKASRLAADAAVEFLRQQGRGFDLSKLDAVHHAIEAHSFSANVPCQTLEARVVQDADRVDALGAIGIARCFSVGGSIKSKLYDGDDPFCENREPNDGKFVVDHFYQKLLKLPRTMQTAAGRSEADRRVSLMEQFLDHLKREIG